MREEAKQDIHSWHNAKKIPHQVPEKPFGGLRQLGTQFVLDQRYLKSKSSTSQMPYATTAEETVFKSQNKIFTAEHPLSLSWIGIAALIAGLYSVKNIFTIKNRRSIERRFSVS